MKNNKGFSMVELVVVITIMVILVGIIVGNLGNLAKWDLNECSEKIDDNLNKIKVMSLSNSTDNPNLKLSMSGNDLLMNVNGVEYDLGKFQVTVYFEDLNRTIETNSSLADQEITISFNNTGEFNEISELSGKYVKKIVITKSSYSKTIICERLTGKHYIK